MQLSHVISSRENNFNLIRMLAAVSVLFSHSFALLKLKDPIAASGLSFGSIAVDIFFICSGLLVTQSLVSRNSNWVFLKARILRIYPAATVMTIAIVLIAGFYLSNLNRMDFFSHPDTLQFLSSNLSLIVGVMYYLPSTFTHNPLSAVNGSLWTITIEIRLYLVIFAGGVLHYVLSKVLRKNLNRTRILKYWTYFIFFISLSFYFCEIIGIERNKTISSINRFLFFDNHRLALLFFIGAISYHLRESFHLKAQLFCLLLLALTSVYFINQKFFIIAYTFGLAYLVLFMAFQRNPIALKYNRVGDYSYGIYIYSFPIQQLFIHYDPKIESLQLAIYSLIATLILAIFSWHVIEKPMLKFK